MRWLWLTLMATLLSMPLFVGIIREWTPKLRPRGYVFAIFVHAVFFATIYACSAKSPVSDFLFAVTLVCWADLTLYGFGRLLTIWVQGRFLNWVDSLTPEQQLARVLVIVTFALVFLMSTKPKPIQEVPKDLTSVSLLMKSTGFLRR